VVCAAGFLFVVDTGTEAGKRGGLIPGLNPAGPQARGPQPHFRRSAHQGSLTRAGVIRATYYYLSPSAARAAAFSGVWLWQST
jgi:hypothetical protein